MKTKNFNSVNLENVKKFVKYQTRLLNLQNGGNAEQNQVYRYKINEYGSKLAKNGINVERLKQIIQRGGASDFENLLEKCSMLKESYKEQTTELQNIQRKLNSTKQNLIQNINELTTARNYMIETNETLRRNTLQLNEKDQNINSLKQQVNTYLQQLNDNELNINDVKDKLANLHDTVRTNNETRELETKTNSVILNKFIEDLRIATPTENSTSIEIDDKLDTLYGNILNTLKDYTKAVSDSSKQQKIQIINNNINAIKDIIDISERDSYTDEKIINDINQKIVNDANIDINDKDKIKHLFKYHFDEANN